MTDGPAIDGALLQWLEESDGRRVRLPVVIHFGDEYKLEYGPVFIGTRTGDPPPDAIHLELDDGAMSVGLFERILDLDADDHLGMVLWLEGRWGYLVPMPDFGLPEDGPKRHPFAVFDIAGEVDPATTHIQLV